MDVFYLIGLGVNLMICGVFCRHELCLGFDLIYIFSCFFFL